MSYKVLLKEKFWLRGVLGAGNETYVILLTNFFKREISKLFERRQYLIGCIYLPEIFIKYK